MRRPLPLLLSPLNPSSMVAGTQNKMFSKMCYTVYMLDFFQCGYASFFRAGNSLICSSLIRSFAHFAQIKWATVSESLRLLRGNERPWANRSRQMSSRERFAQVAQRKWANERFAQKFWQNNSKILFFSMFYAGLGTPFFSVRYVSFFSILKKECSILFRSFLKFLATYETQKSVLFFSVLF